MSGFPGSDTRSEARQRGRSGLGGNDRCPRSTRDEVRGNGRHDHKTQTRHGPNHFDNVGR